MHLIAKFGIFFSSSKKKKSFSDFRDDGRFGAVFGLSRSESLDQPQNVQYLYITTETLVTLTELSALEDAADQGASPCGGILCSAPIV